MLAGDIFCQESKFDDHLGAGEVSVSEVVEDGVHCVVLATPRGHLVIVVTAPHPATSAPAAGGQGAVQVVRGARGEQGQGASHVRLLK